MSLDTRAALRTRIAPAIGLAALAVGTMWLRTSNVSQDMWLLADQVRDWRVALLPWRELPGHGPPSIAGGYSFGPIFYWTLWTYARVGRAFADSLPHTAVVVQAVVSGLIDLVLCAAIYRRLGSWSVAIGVLLWQVSAPTDLVVARTLWNPNQALDFGKLAIALVLWRPADLTTARRMAIAGTAVLSAQAHWSGLPVAVSILGWLVARAVFAERRVDVRGLMEIGAVLVVLQLPATLDGSITSLWPTAGAGAVASVTLGGAIQRARDALYVMANSIERFLVAGIGPQRFAILLAVGALASAVRLRHEWDLAAVTIAPLIVVLLLVLTWPGRIEDYWFRVVALSAALLLVVGLIEISRRIGAAPAAAGAVLLAVGLVLLPYRIRAASQLGRLPAYGPLVRASRALAASAGRVREVAVPWYPGVIEGIPIGGFIPNTPNEDASAVYEFAGGRLDPSARQSAVLHEDGTFELRND
jgi:hypothetical protein